MFLIPANILMHIPDGFLNIFVSLACWVLTLIILGLAVANTRRDLDERLVPLAGIMAAFIFAAQMLNFPVAGGTSGHFIGAALAFLVLGPWLGLLAMTAVVAVQALLFQDGGLVVMGANILVMGIVPGFLAYGIHRWGRGHRSRIQLLLTGGAAWVSVVTAATIVSLLLAFSGTSSLNVVLPAMIGVHALIGLGEALITVAALTFIRRTRPSLLEEGQSAGRGGWVVGGLGVALLLVLIAPFASGHPDGLEWVAGQSGFLHTAQGAPYSILPDYTVPFLGETGLSTIAAGIIGVLLVAALVYLAARTLRRRQTA
ncbi:MAG: energy-coupling factor ABC transporter permease [Candidatus Promineofilum sp.]|nr:energy-coupling factor ABC transporter permease [Promineifilum sp.]